ncbi:FBP domain-containing protein [Actinomadura macra]|uniref:FBP domain-containing protein n=1 Tax=Actinomadura macra TaxID=46164 RepID=UPI000830DB52|nr:FBP domain-containing protein [Actinomadura macra]
MRAITESDVRGSFVNCSKGETKRLGLPKDLQERPWDDLDFLGWRDPGAPGRAYLVAERGGRLVGIALRAVTGTARGFTSRSMCSLCLTTHSGGGVALMTARRTGEAGRQGNTVGQYFCTDLACSLFIRGRKQTSAGGGLDETLSVEEKVARARLNLTAFIDKVIS